MLPLTQISFVRFTRGLHLQMKCTLIIMVNYFHYKNKQLAINYYVSIVCLRKIKIQTKVLLLPSLNSW
jgi:hypothetical protein